MEEKARPPPFMISYHPFYRDLNQQNGKSPGHCKAWPGDFYFLKVNFPIFLFFCEYGCFVCMCSWCLWKPDEIIEFLGTGVRDGCEAP